MTSYAKINWYCAHCNDKGTCPIGRPLITTCPSCSYGELEFSSDDLMGTKGASKVDLREVTGTKRERLRQLLDLMKNSHDVVFHLEIAKLISKTMK